MKAPRWLTRRKNQVLLGSAAVLVLGAGAAIVLVNGGGGSGLTAAERNVQAACRADITTIVGRDSLGRPMPAAVCNCVVQQVGNTDPHPLGDPSNDPSISNSDFPAAMQRYLADPAKQAYDACFVQVYGPLPPVPTS